MKLNLRATVLVVLSFLSLPAMAAQSEQAKVINDAWYTMQSKSTPWGYYHERIELRDGKYTYRYEMLKQENANEPYEENIGAIAEKDFTPVAFNLNKNGGGVIETVNGSYKKTPTSTSMKITIQGARNMTIDRGIPKNGILEVFFPVWVAQNLEALRKKPKGSIPVFAENPNSGDFNSRNIYYEFKGENASKKCLEVQAEMDAINSVWCIEKTGATHSIEFKQAQVLVERVSGETEAKNFVKTRLKKGK